MTVEAWKELTAIALLGTQRRAPAWPALPGGIAGIVQCDPGNPERTILDAAAALGTWRAAGMCATPVIVGEVQPFAGEQPCPARAARMLAAAAAEGRAEALPELLGLVAVRGRVLAADALPALLDQGTRDTRLRQHLGPVLGARGRWLASLRKEWGWVGSTLDSVNPEAWESGDRQSRAAFLRELRSRDPGEARALLAACWTSEPAVNRREFVATLSEQLSPDDEAFLESALDDRSSEVRLAATALLASLRGSAFTARMTARLEAAIRQSGGTVDFELPDELDQSARRDGVDLPRHGKDPRRGAKANRLIEIISAVPLSFWEHRFGGAAKAAAARLRASEWKGAIFAGLGVATVRQRNRAWAAVLVDHDTPDHTLGIWSSADLYALVEPAERDALLARSSSSGPPAGLVESHPAPWGIPATEAVARYLTARYRAEPAAFYAHADLLRLLATRGNRAAFPQVFGAFAAATADGRVQPQFMITGLETYRLRHEFEQELDR